MILAAKNMNVAESTIEQCFTAYIKTTFFMVVNQQC